MILAAGLLVVLALGLFVAGVVTGITALYWACVAVSALTVLMVAVRRRPPASVAAVPGAEAAPAGPATTAPVADGRGEPAPRTSHPEADDGQRPVDRPRPGAGAGREPPAEEVEFADLLLVMDLRDPVHVVDRHPRYHLAGCRHLSGGQGVAVPLDQARADGFTPCGVCAPDQYLARVELARRGGRRR